MRLPALLALLAALMMSCHESERSISVTETRSLTLFDQKYPGNIKDFPPLSWRRIPGTEMRAFNYLTGPDDSVEIFMGNSGGGALPNVNRWLGQFGGNRVETLESFEKIEVLGREAILIEAEGKYSSGMGQAPKDNQALLGFIRASGDGVLTLKIVGPAEVVKPLRQDFLNYATSLKFEAPQALPEPAAETPTP